MVQEQGINNYFVLLAGTTGMIVLALGIVLFFVIYQKKLLLQKWQKQQMATAFQAELLYSNIKTLEKERSRIASDLHDEIGGKLSALRLQVVQMGRKHNEQANHITEAKDLIDQTIDNVRRISYDLLPPGLEEFGLDFAIRNLCDKIVKYSDLVIAIDIAMQAIRCDYVIELSLYRILQELINNTLKHSGATKVNISIQELPDQLSLIYYDNGKGYEYSPDIKSNTLGLKNIVSRANLINGALAYDTSADNDVQVSITIPMHKNTA